MVLGLAIFGAVLALLTLVVIVGVIVAAFATNPRDGAALEME